MSRSPSASKCNNTSMAYSPLAEMRLSAQEDAADERRLQKLKKSWHKMDAEKKAAKKAREAEKAQEIERLNNLNNLAHREAKSLQLPRRIMMWDEDSARGSISLEALEAILSIQSKMIAAFLAILDKKVPLLLPGARLSAVEKNQILPRAGSTPRLPLNHTAPCIFSKRHVSFGAVNTVVFSRTPTPSFLG